MSKRKNIIRKCLLITPNVQLKVQSAEILSAEGPLTAIRRIFGPATEISSYLGRCIQRKIQAMDVDEVVSTSLFLTDKGDGMECIAWDLEYLL